MKRTAAVVLLATLGLAASLNAARAEAKWLRCSLNEDIVRTTDGKETSTPLPAGGSVIFIIDDMNQSFATFREDNATMTKLQADVKPRSVTFFDGPLSDSINRVTGTFSVVKSPYHEAHGACAPIDPILKEKPKF